MKKHLALLLVLMALSTAAFAQSVPSIAGDWEGALDVGTRLRLVLHLARNAEGRWTGTIDSPDQSASDIPIETVTLKELKLYLGVTRIGGVYEGTVNKELSAISGEWKQSGQSFPLEFRRPGAEKERSAARPASAALTDADIKKILQDRVDLYKKSVGIVVGLVNDKGTRVVSYGKLSRDGSREVNADTVYEIGSITKVFTSILLADMVEHGEMALNDPVSKYLPTTVKVPARDGKEITLLSLATHTSGLPRLPGNLKPADALNPYADYTVQQMYDFLSGYTLTRDIGSKYEYSNLGGGLLGHVLALRAGTTYEDQVRKRILAPLKMTSTAITLTPELQARLAAGHGPALNAVRNWDLPTLAGAGALRSTVNDMLRFVSANLGLIETPLAPALARSHQIQVPTGMPDVEIALAWHVFRKYGDIIWHNGGTGGYHSFIGFDKKKRLGVVVLSNSANDIDDIGRHLLESQFPLARLEPPVERKAIKLDAALLDVYVGEYALAPNFTITVTREGEGLFIQATAQPKLEVSPESETKFFLKVVDAQITFVKDDKGQVTHLVLHQGGANQQAKKIK